MFKLYNKILDLNIKFKISNDNKQIIIIISHNLTNIGKSFLIIQNFISIFS